MAEATQERDAEIVEGRELAGRYSAVWETADGSRMILAGREAHFDAPEEAAEQANGWLWPMAACAGLRHRGEVVRLEPDLEVVPHSITHGGQTADFLVLSGPLFDDYERKPEHDWFYQGEGPEVN